MNWSSLAAVLLGLAVILGAFGAHVLQSRLDSSLLGVYRGGVTYQFIHALGLLVVSALTKTGHLRPKVANWVCGLLLLGIVLFSGSLYLLAITGIETLGVITPIGGFAFIAGWFLLAWGLTQKVD